MKKWFFTFGKGALFQSYYVEVFASSFIKAGETMCCYYGSAWSQQYSRADWFSSFYTVAVEYHLNYLETLVYSEEVEEYIKKYDESIKNFK